MDLALYKRENPCYNLSCSGPVVQSVSTPACHAGGRRFESVPGRQKRGTILWMVPLFWANRGGLERLNPPLLWRGGQRVRAPLPPYGLPMQPATSPFRVALPAHPAKRVQKRYHIGSEIQPGHTANAVCPGSSYRLQQLQNFLFRTCANGLFYHLAVLEDQ